MKIGIGLGVTHTRSKGVLVPPAGFAFLVDDDGYYLTDDDGYYLVGEI